MSKEPEIPEEATNSATNLFEEFWEGFITKVFYKLSLGACIGISYVDKARKSISHRRNSMVTVIRRD